MAAIIESTRARAAFLVAREERSAGSRMAAYERVASLVGTSAEWLRKFIGRDERCKPSLVTGANIISLYETWCSRLDEKIAAEKAAIVALRQRIHETDPEGIRALASSLSQAKDAEGGG